MCFKDRKVCLCRPGNIHVTEEGMCKHSDTCSSDGQNTDPQSMEHPNGQPQWTNPISCKYTYIAHIYLLVLVILSNKSLSILCAVVVH